jgi:hypothetical protein
MSKRRKRVKTAAILDRLRRDDNELNFEFTLGLLMRGRAVPEDHFLNTLTDTGRDNIKAAKLAIANGYTGLAEIYADEELRKPMLKHEFPDEYHSRRGRKALDFACVFNEYDESHLISKFVAIGIAEIEDSTRKQMEFRDINSEWAGRTSTFRQLQKMSEVPCYPPLQQRPSSRSRISYIGTLF